MPRIVAIFLTLSFFLTVGGFSYASNFSATSPTWQDARHLPGNIFEKELPLQAGANTLDIRAEDGNQNTSNYQYSLNLASGTPQPYIYDTAGRVTFDGTRTYVWDPMSRLIRIEWGAGSNKVTQYRYNSIGQRTETIEKTGSTITAHYRYLYDGLMPLCRYNGGQTAAHIDRRYYSQGEERKENGTWVSYYYCRDHLGSIREVVKGDGTLAARYDYDPYGLRLTRYQAASYTNCDFGYTGHITQHSPVSGQSEIVLTLYRAYDPIHARWLTPDPIGEAGGLNLYEYVSGNPINGIDPMGLEFWTWGDSDSEDRLPSAGEMAESTAHFIQGMGDNISFGATRKGRDAIWGNDYTDPCRDAYKWGGRAGTALEMATGAGGIAKGLTKGGFKMAAGAAYKKGTSMSYRNVRKRLGYHGIVGKGENVHHWLISQSRAKKWGIPNSVLNHRANLMPLSREVHEAVHNSVLDRLTSGVPDFAKQAAAGLGGAAADGSSECK